MKKKFLGIFAIFALLSLAIAAYAYTQNTTPNSEATASCCKGKDSCPMKGKSEHAEGGDHAKTSCCKKHDGGDHAKKAEGACCDCCGDSCPMKKGDGTAKAEDGKSCCDNCECCKGKVDSAA